MGGIAVVGAAAGARGEPAGDVTAAAVSVVQSVLVRARVSPTVQRVGSVATTVAADCVTLLAAVDQSRRVGCLSVSVPSRERKEKDG